MQQAQFEQVVIGDIWLDLKSHDNIPNETTGAKGFLMSGDSRKSKSTISELHTQARSEPEPKPVG